MNRAALDALDVRPGDRVLEVGFGGGDLLRALLAAGAAEVTGIDVSGAMVARAADRFRNDRDRLRLVAASADSLPLPTAAIDKACSVNALYFWHDPAAVFAEFARVLVPGGLLLLCFQTEAQVRRWPGHLYGFRAFGEAEVKDLLAAAGFKWISAQSGHDQRLGDFLCLSARLVDAKAAV